MSMRSDRSPIQSVVRAVSGVTFVGASIVCAAPSLAQTRSVRDTATAYGARLNARGLPANTNPARVNNRVPSRIENRLSLRIERYRPEASTNPTAAFQAATSDGSRTAPVIAPPQPVDGDDPQR